MFVQVFPTGRGNTRYLLVRVQSSGVALAERGQGQRSGKLVLRIGSTGYEGHRVKCIPNLSIARPDQKCTLDINGDKSKERARRFFFSLASTERRMNMVPRQEIILRTVCRLVCNGVNRVILDRSKPNPSHGCEYRVIMHEHTTVSVCMLHLDGLYSIAWPRPCLRRFHPMCPY